MGKATKFHFTQKRIESLPAPESGRVVYGDAGEQGLTLTVNANGHRYFSWYRKVQNYPEWRAIGPFPELGVEDARTRAKELSAAVARWKADGYKGPSPLARREDMTLATLVDEYVARHLKHHSKNPEDAEADVRWTIGKYAAAWRSRKLDAIRHEDVRALFRKIGAKHPRTANAVKELISRLYGFAARERLWTGENPAAGITGYPNVKRDRYLQPDELPKLWAALRAAPNPDLQDFVNLALWTGVRKSDLLSARWSDVSFESNKWTIPNPKSSTPYDVPLTPEAVAIFRERHNNRLAGNDWVFPSRAKTKTGHVVDLKRAWKKLLTDAGLAYSDDPTRRIRQHDLRRTQASFQAAQGSSLIVIGKSLGHAAGSSATAIYSRLDLDPIRESMMAANLAINKAMRKKVKKPKLLKPADQKRKVAVRG